MTGTPIDERLGAALARFEDADADPVGLLRGLVDAIRPRRRDDAATATTRWRAMNALLSAHPGLRDAVGSQLRALLGSRRVTAFFTEAGMLPNAGFFSELSRKLAHKLLPTVPDARSLRDCIDLVFHDPRDHRWLDAVPIDDRLAFWRLVWSRQDGHALEAPEVVEELLEAALIVSHRTTALGLEPELLRVCPEVQERASPFLALHDELGRFVDGWRRLLADPAATAGDERQVLVFVEQCRAVLRRAYRVASTQGASLALTYLLKRLGQHLERLELLVLALGALRREDGQAAAVEHWAIFIRDAVRGQIQRNSIRRHFSDLVGLLALRVTENASQVGEHYITSDWAGWRVMWGSAMGAGGIIAVMALLKVFASKLDLAPIGYAIAYSLVYGLGFVVIALLHLTIATKQPAMTAATLAAAVSQSRGRLADTERLVDLVVDTMRSQLAAILGNVVLAMATAGALAWALAGWTGHAPIDAGKARHLLDEIHPWRSAALWYAAIAGVWLFVAGLLTGAIDNAAAYSRFGDRVARLRWLRAVAGRRGAERVGRFLHDRLGLIGGNFLFGCLLGSTGTLGFILGLPLDIRHVAFASANFAYALTVIGGELRAGEIAVFALGVGAIGAVNLTVSFALALGVALRSRGATFASAADLPRRVLARWRDRPGSFFVPPRGTAAPG